MFRRWAAIFTVGAAAERRVWSRTGAANYVYPNLFMFLVGPPATGKTQAILPAMEILRRSEASTLAPNDVSKQGLLDALSKGGKAIANPPGMKLALYEYHYLTVAIRELSNFMSQYDQQLAGMLTDIFDNPPVNDELKRVSKSTGPIVNPSMSLLAGTATKNLGATISGDLWGQGFMSRVLLVYSAETPTVDIFQFMDDESTSAFEYPANLINHLVAVAEMKGPMSWAPSARASYNDWLNVRKRKPYPMHPKLVEYNGRRWMHVVKVSMIVAMSRGSMTVEGADFNLALALLEQAERAMPEIFKEMTSHNDGEVLRDLHQWMWAVYARNGQKPITVMQVTQYLYVKVASRDIGRLIEVGESAGLYDRMAGTSGPTAKYKPLAALGLDLDSLS